MDLAPGERVDRYTLVQLLGEGGQGAVWKAEDPLEPGRPRALKLVPLNPSRPSDVERIRREARALARLDHPSLVRCHGLFEDLRFGVLGLSMDYVDGASLRGLRDRPELGPHHRVALLRHIAGALAYLHGEGIVHRDLKPENVLVTSAFLADPDDPANVKLVDFGIASQEGNPNPLTALDSVVGTLSYLAPELVDPGFFGRQVCTPAADVFAFGVLGWQLLAGTRHPTGLPASASIVEYGLEYRRIAQLGTPFPSDAPGGDWGELLKGCLAVRVTERIANGQELSSRCALAARSSVVIRPRATGDGPASERPTALESPAASVGRTAAMPAGDATALAVPQRATTAAAVTGAATPARSRTGSLVLTLGVIAAAGLAGSAWLLFGPDDGGSRTPPPAPSASSTLPAAESALPVPPPSASSSAEAAAPATLPAGCAPDASLCACCPSGRDCGGACDERLPPDTKLELRLATVKGDTTPDLQVCAGAKDVSPAMTCADGGAPMLSLTVRDLEHGGLAVQVHTAGKTATRTDAVFTDGITRASLCQGLVVGGLQGDAHVEQVRFYLDPEGSATAASCP